MVAFNVKHETESENNHMITIDKALSMYSDKIVTGENVNLEEICVQLDESDRKEFTELAEMVLMTMNLESKITNQSFDEFFGKLNAYKESVYGK